MEAASKSINRHEDILLNLCRHVLALPLEAGTKMTRNGEPIDQNLASTASSLRPS